MKSPRTLPPGWALSTLGDIRIDSSATLDPAKSQSETFELYSIPAFPSGRPEAVKGEAIGSTKQTLAPRTVVVSKINPRISRVWVVGDDTGRRKIGSSEWIPFFPVGGINPHFLAYYMRQDEFRNYLASNVSGVGGSLMRVRPATIDPFPLVLAPIAEQSRIVASIESYFTRLDDAVATLERVQRNLERYRASVLKAAVEGRLVPTEAELARAEGRDYEPASVLLERILAERRRRWEEAELARLRLSGVSHANDQWKLKYEEPGIPAAAEPHELPEGWAWVTVDQLSSRLQYGYTASAVEHAEGVRFLRITDIQNGAVDWHAVPSCEIAPEDVAHFQLKPGDIVFARTGATVGKSFRIREPLPRSVFASYLIRLEVASQPPSRWLEVFFGSPFYWQQIRGAQVGTGQPNVNSTRLARLVLPVPPHAEQSRIADEAERLVSLSRALEASVAAERTRINRCRQSILRWAFEGKLVVQDPSDEPASKLLERIRADRAASASEGPKRTGRRKAKTAV